MNKHLHRLSLGFTAFSLITCSLTAQDSRVWGTYLGGSDRESGGSVAIDAQGNIYLTGSVGSSGIFNGAGGHDVSYNGGFYDAFLIKFNSAGSRLWATYYGGTGSDYGTSVAVDASGNVYMSGTTESAADIASGGHDNTYSGGTEDVFLVKFNSAGTRQWATYYGGTKWDRGGHVAVDQSGNVYLAGSTLSETDIAFNGDDNTIGAATTNDAFLAQFNSAGVRQWATYYGGADGEIGTDVATDATGNVFLVGYTCAFSTDCDAVLVKYDAAGNRAWVNTYGPGGATESDYAYDVATDAAGNVYIAGHTSSTTGIASGGFQNAHSGGLANEAYLVKFAPNGSRIWGTYYGFTSNDYGTGVAVDATGNVYFSGYTSSSSNISAGGFQTNFGGGYDGFLVKFNSSCGRLCATYYGGTGSDYGNDVAVSALSGNVLVSGTTGSSNNIGSGGYDNSFGGGTDDAFLVQFTSVCSALPVDLLYFTAELNPDGTVSARWALSQQAPGEYFEVQRSRDGKNFETIGTIMDGTSLNGTVLYEYEDTPPYDGTAYYRLRMISPDGQSAYSVIREVTPGTTEGHLRVYPNPATEYIQYSFECMENTPVTVKVMDLFGREVLVQEALAGKGTQKLNISGLDKGNYLLVVKLRNSKGDELKTEQPFVVK